MIKLTQWLNTPQTRAPAVGVLVDPVDAYDLDMDTAPEVLGLVPRIFADAALSLVERAENERDTLALACAVANAYGFGGLARPASDDGLVIDPNVYTYHYPNHYPLYPLALMRGPYGAQLIQYSYGLVVFRIGTGAWYFTRLD